MDNKPKKLVVIMGSPHLNGNAASAADAVARGAEQAGIVTVKYNLAQLKLQNCIGCRKCVETTVSAF